MQLFFDFEFEFELVLKHHQVLSNSDKKQKSFKI